MQHTHDHGNRAGKYVKQATGYRAFIPAPLPPNPSIKVEGEIQTLLSKADRALGRLDGSIQTLPHPDLFVAMYVRKEAVLSSQIEGTQSSLQDVIAAEAKILNPDRPRDVDEVFNYVRAMNHGLEQLHVLPVSMRLIKEIHKHLLAGVRGEHLSPGHLRTNQNWIGPSNCTLHEATFIPPPPHYVPDALSDMENFLHQDDHLPLLIKIGIAHAHFETVHPFLDGNGRVGRLLITFLLCERKVLLKPVLYLSHYFKRYRSEYYEHLQAIRDRGDWERWMVFFLKGIYEVSQNATNTARQILLLRERHRQLITDRLGRAAGNGYRVLEFLYQNPIITVKEVEGLIDTTYPAANNLVKKLVECEILRAYSPQKRHRPFVYADYLDLFFDGQD